MLNKSSNLRKVILGAVAGAFVAIGATGAVAYPTKPVTFIVPYSPGGGSDQQARRLQPGLEKALGVKVRIVYKTGGLVSYGDQRTTAILSVMLLFQTLSLQLKVKTLDLILVNFLILE